MKLTKKQIQDMVDSAFDTNRSITVITYYLSNYGEMIVNTIGERLLQRFDRLDLGDIMYTAIKELVMNAAKANLKRALINIHNLDPEKKEEDYKLLMKLFKENIREVQIRKFRHHFKKNNMPITINFSFKQNEVLYIKVKNAFGLLPHEETRIREKFDLSTKYSDLMEYYMDHGDETEGAGMGITLVEILLGQSGFDRHLFTIYTDRKEKQTIARVEIPLSGSYLPKRLQFHQELQNQNVAPEILRKSEQFRRSH